MVTSWLLLSSSSSTSSVDTLLLLLLLLLLQNEIIDANATTLNNKTLHFRGDLSKLTITLDGAELATASHLLDNCTVGANGYVYPIDRVFGLGLRRPGGAP